MDTVFSLEALIAARDCFTAGVTGQKEAPKAFYQGLCALGAALCEDEIRKAQEPPTKARKP